MKKCLFFVVLATLAVLTIGCGAKRSQASYVYKSKVLSANYDGSYVIRTQVHARNAAIAFTDAQRKVVNEVIFKGVEGNTPQIKDLRPILMEVNAEEKYEDYFNAFFVDGGDWTQFVNLKDKRTGTTHYVRDGKQMIETVTVSVYRDALVKKLKADGILK